jgi:antitoxin PrlF
MIYSGIVRSKGQITIPLEVRKRLGVRQGEKLEFVVDGSATILRPAKHTGNPFAQFRGALADTRPGGVAEIVRWQRAMRGRDRT